eukprot:Ihof_evm1s552 gene=Ihof_evmTU1s552
MEHKVQGPSVSPDPPHDGRVFSPTPTSSVGSIHEASSGQEAEPGYSVDLAKDDTIDSASVTEPPSTRKFGTWDGVFISCVINIFGVILFLRMGYIAGNMGVGASMGLVLLVYVMSFVTILSTAGICNTCALKKGGVYAIIKQSLGTQIGGVIGIIYCFGLATMNAVFVLGFAEAFCDVAGWNLTVGNLRTVGMVMEVLVLLVMLTGVEWVIKLQLVLLLLLWAAIFNFIIGGFMTPTFNMFFTQNLRPRYDNGVTFFDMLGLLFATTSGIMAGANMSGDLKHPAVNIPVGTIAAISVTSIIYAIFILICASVALASTDQEGVSKLGYLKVNYLIAQSVSGTESIYFLGLFTAAVSSALGIFIGAPRVMQGIGEDVHAPGIEQLAKGWGKNNEPLRATIVVAIITAGFVIMGDLNAVAPVMTIVLCVAHGGCNYAYFALATGGLREEAQTRQLKEFGKHTVNVDTRANDLMKDAALANAPKDDFRKPPDWVMLLTNRWVSLLNCVWHIAIIFLIQWWQGLIMIGVFVILYMYIGVFNKNDNKLGDADFSLRMWLNPLHHPTRIHLRAKQ